MGLVLTNVSLFHFETPYSSAFLLFFPLLIIFCFSVSDCLLGYRYLRPLVADVAVVAKCHLSALYRHDKGKLFAQLVDLLQFYENFEINDHVGTQLTDDEVLQSHYDRFQSFQLLAFKKIPKVCYKQLVYDASHYQKIPFLIIHVVFFFSNNYSCC